MVNYKHPVYAGGTMLTVIRGADRNWEGDPNTTGTTEHQIGPCDIKWHTDTEDSSKGESVTVTARVTAPHGSDVLETDRIRGPGGREFVIDGQVRETPNGFTGWTTGVRFSIAKDGPRGVRQR